MARRLARSLLAASLAAPLLAIGPVPPHPAAATCATRPDLVVALRDAEFVLVGSVVALENDARWVTVRVEESWRGPFEPGTTVEVRAGPEPGAASVVDRVFAPSRYLLLPRSGPGHLVDDACSATRPWSEELAVHRPATVEPWVDPADRRSPGPLDDPVLRELLLPALAAAAVLAALALVVRRLRRPPDWVR